VKPHEIFKVEGGTLNVVSEIPLSITEAILGCNISVETLDGMLNVAVKAGTNSGTEMVLKHHGMPPFHPPENYDVEKLRGDHILRFKILIPKNMTEQ
jgi:DnaJ-class molecular chaperone